MSLRQEQLRAIQNRYDGMLTESDLKIIAETFSSKIAPAINRLELHALSKAEATNIGSTLLVQSSFQAITNNDELDLPESHALQGLTFLANKIFDEKNPANAEQVSLLLKNLYDKYPETIHITEFNDLSLQAELILDDEGNESSIISYAKDKLSLQKKIGAEYITNARTAFTQWKSQRKKYTGSLCRIIELIDKLALKFPAIKNEIIVFSQIMLRYSLTRREIIEIELINFNELVNILIALDDEKIVSSICRHIEDGKLNIMMLTQISAHANFKMLTSSERRIVFSVLATLLNSKQPYKENYLLAILNKCADSNFRIALLQRLNEFYRQPPFPPIAILVEWINAFSSTDAQNIATALEASYILFNNDNSRQEAALKSSHALLAKQLNKLKHEMNAYSHTSFLHTRKFRADYLGKLSAKQLVDVDKKDIDETQNCLQRTIAELYLHYSTIENPSGIISSTLEKRLLKLLRIPKNDAIKEAIAQRSSFLYKLHHFFGAAFCCFSQPRNKANDPIHHIIWQHLPNAIKIQVDNLRTEISLLDQLDRSETSIFDSPSATLETMADITSKIQQ